MPGVRALLDALSPRDVCFGAAHRDFEVARARSSHIRSVAIFRCVRSLRHARSNRLLEQLQRSQTYGLLRPESSRIVVVGDTPLDVAVAKAGGVRSAAVATGSYGPTALQASGADVVLEDFSDLAATLVALGC